MYEYVCMKCEEHFEELVRGDEQVACPQCGATNVSRQLSTFALSAIEGALLLAVYVVYTVQLLRR